MHTADHGGRTLTEPDFPRRSRLRVPQLPAFLADLPHTAEIVRSRALHAEVAATHGETRAATAASVRHPPEAWGDYAR
ncbi:hypothetical protein GmRootA79_18600 [Acidovorax sp. A79]|uniref:hypothetical protein n=1 Tax=Acidovorax sp. A79 TaxID=3056107 RepID=UPI0034E89A72